MDLTGDDPVQGTFQLTAASGDPVGHEFQHFI